MDLFITDSPERTMLAIERALTHLFRSEDPADHEAAKRLHWAYWRLDDLHREQRLTSRPCAEVIPFLPPVTAQVRKLDPTLWPTPAT